MQGPTHDRCPVKNMLFMKRRSHFSAEKQRQPLTGKSKQRVLAVKTMFDLGLITMQTSINIHKEFATTGGTSFFK